MKKVIITGPTGMIGKLALQDCLRREEVERVTAITRRKTGVEHGKLREVVHSDFLDYSAISNELKDHDLALYCIGVYTGALPDGEFERITVDYTKAFASALLEQSDKPVFCFLSGAGADRTEKSRMIFARTKGAAENFLLEQDFSRVHIFRPGYIYPVTPRKEPNFGYRAIRSLYPFLSKLFPNMGISSQDLARAMVEVGLQGGEKDTFENQDIREQAERLCE